MKLHAVIAQAVISAACLFMQSGLADAADDLSLKAQPMAVQAYILREAVEAGVADPWAIELNKPTDFGIADAPGNDLNGDGKRDYAVSLCAFNNSEPAFRTNGFECAYGNLILSNAYGGHDFIPVSGLIRKAKPGEAASLIMQERSFGDCKDYFCDVLYRIELDDTTNKPVLKQLERCEPDQCKLP